MTVLHYCHLTVDPTLRIELGAWCYALDNQSVAHLDQVADEVVVPSVVWVVGEISEINNRVHSSPNVCVEGDGPHRHLKRVHSL